MGSVNALLGFVIGGTAAVGALVAGLGFIGVPDHPARRTVSLPRLDAVVARIMWSTAAGVLAALLTRWAAAFVIGALAAVLAPTLVGARAKRDAVIARTEAVASWAEMLRDTMAASAGLQAAIAVTAAVAPEPIAPQARELARSMQREGLPAALRRFATEVDDPAADIVAVALTVAATRQASHVGEVLDRAASAARASAAMRVSVEASRARTYTSARIIVTVTAGMGCGIALLSRSYLDPFDAAAGQLVLLVIAALFGAGLWSLSRMAQIDSGPRVLLNTDRMP